MSDGAAMSGILLGNGMEGSGIGPLICTGGRGRCLGAVGINPGVPGFRPVIDLGNGLKITIKSKN